MSLATGAMPSLPPGTLPPVIMPFDPTSTVPIGLVALNSQTEGESTLYDVGRYEVRSMIMSNPGAVAPVVYGGKVRAVMLYLNRDKMQARGLSPLDVMKAMDNYNVFLPAGDAKFGGTDYAIDSNSMYDLVERMGEMPLRTEHGNAAFVRDVATPKDDAFIQTNIVRVDGRKQVYIPVFRQLGASTLSVIDAVKASLDDMKDRLSKPGIDLKLVMDQSVYVRQSISSLVQEGVIGSVLCSLVILLFLGQIRMTAIAIMTLPLSVLAAVVALLATGNTINVMTLSGLSLAIGPMIDSAIICLENTHRHLVEGATPEEASYKGASEVALPELVSTLCTFLVLAPLALMPGLGAFLFRPMALAVAFAMIASYILSRTFVPSRSAMWLKGHDHGHDAAQGADRPRLRPVGTGDRPRRRHLRHGLERRPPPPADDDRRGLRGAGAGPGDDHADHPPRVLPRGRRRLVRDVRPGAERHADREHQRPDRPGREVRPDADPQGRPRADRLRDRRHPRLVGRLHPQRRPDGRDRPDPARPRARRLGAGVCQQAPRRASPARRGSPTSNSPSTPAA